MHPEVVQVSLTRPATLIGIIMTFLTLGGFALLIAGARTLAPVVQGEDPVVAMIFMGMVIILIVDIFLARQLTKLINASLTGPKTSARGVPAAVSAPHLSRPDTAPFLPASSVTENTTRFLESDYRAPVAPQPAEKQNS